jgi:hypothetical protein
MDPAEAIASVGVAIVLIAFALNVAGLLERTTVLYLGCNATGAALACLSSVMIGFLPFVLLEGVWAAVALSGLVAQGWTYARGRRA